MYDLYCGATVLDEHSIRGWDQLPKWEIIARFGYNNFLFAQTLPCRRAVVTITHESQQTRIYRPQHISLNN